MAVKVLIVEDEAIVAADVEQMLLRRGYDPVGIASSGREAILQARKLQPTVILMDVRLRGPMNGIEAARQIEAERTIPVIYVTAFTERAVSLLPPNSRCLAKPFAPAQLIGAIEAAIAGPPSGPTSPCV